MTLFSRTRPKPVTGPPHLGDAVSKAEFKTLMSKIERIEKRGIRTETRVTRLLEHHGLDTRGQPVPADT